MLSTKIAQIDDKSCNIAWCPLNANPNAVALGTKVGDIVKISLLFIIVFLPDFVCCAL